MRLLIIITLAVGFTCHLRGDEESSKFLSDSQLIALGEPRLDNAKPDNSLVRIIVLQSLEAPIMIKWLIKGPGAQSEAVVRRPKMEVSKDGAAVYRGLDVASLSQFCILPWNLTGVNDLLYFQNKNAQQAGADQPAASPADKVPAKIQPSTPTPKDGPR